MEAIRDAGLPEDGILQVARTIGMGTARIAEANRELVLRTLMQPGDTERDLALRFAAAAEQMLPLIGPTLVYALQAHMLEQIRRDVIGAADLASGEIGRHLGAHGLLRGPGRLHQARRAGGDGGARPGRRPARRDGDAVAEPPVRLVKLIGDAAMLVSTDTEAMLGAALSLVETAGSRRRRVPSAARRHRPRLGPRPGRGLLRPPSEHGEPHRRYRLAGERPGRRGDEAGGAARASTTPSPASAASRAFDSRLRLYRARRVSPGDPEPPEQGPDRGLPAPLDRLRRGAEPLRDFGCGEALEPARRRRARRRSGPRSACRRRPRGAPPRRSARAPPSPPRTPRERGRSSRTGARTSPPRAPGARRGSRGGLPDRAQRGRDRAHRAAVRDLDRPPPARAAPTSTAA